MATATNTISTLLGGTQQALADPEKTQRREEINALYQKYLGRDAERAGLDYWMREGQYADLPPLTMEDIEYNIAISEEASDYNVDQALDALSFLSDTTADDEVIATTDDEDVVDVTSGDIDSVDVTEDIGDRLYDYTNQRETGDSQNLYWNNFSKQLTQEELQQEFNAQDNGQLRKAFGSFDNYLAYMNERQDLIDAGELKADWWDTGVALIDPESLDREAGMDDRALETTIIQSGVEKAKTAYEAQSATLNSLYEKYTGTSGPWYNSDGDKFEWNGTSFVKTAKVDDSVNMGKLIPAIILGAAAGALTGPLATAIGGGTATAATTAAASTILNGATQLALTGNVDFKQALVAGLSSYGLESIAQSSAIQEYGDAVGNAQSVSDLASAGVPQEILDNVINGVNPFIEAANQSGVTQDIIEGVVSAATGVILGDPGFVGTVSGPLSQLPNYGIPQPETTDESGGGGDSSATATTTTDADSSAADASAADAASTDADNDGEPASTDPDDNDPNVTSATKQAPSDVLGGTGGTGGVDAGGESQTTVLKDVGGTGKDLEILKTNPFGDDEDGFAGFILVDETGTWGVDGRSTIRHVQTGVEIEVDWETGTYDSEYVFGGTRTTTDDEGIDTSGDSTTAGDAGVTSGDSGADVVPTPAPAPKPVGWIWDVLAQVWNPIFTNSIIPEGAIVAKTSTKPTQPPANTTTTTTTTTTTGDEVITNGDGTGDDGTRKGGYGNDGNGDDGSGGDGNGDDGNGGDGNGDDGNGGDGDGKK